MLLWAPFVSLAQTSEARVTRIEPEIIDQQLTLDVDFQLSLGAMVRDAAERGVPLHFAVDLEISSPRWWWLDKVLVQTSMSRRVTFNTLTRQWRVAAGDLFMPVESLDEALKIISRIRGWPVSPTDRFEPGVKYEGRVRLRLDASQLALPLQIESSKRSEWALSSSWQPFDFSIRRPGTTQ
jgi:hypothetical protein